MKWSSIRRKRAWFCATIGGLAGATGLAAVSIAGSPWGAETPSEVRPASARQVAPPSAAAPQVGKGGEAHDKKSENGDSEPHDTEVEVRCDPDRLIAALVHANADSGATLSLAKKCTYTLTANQDGNGLPLIVQPVSIKGNGATIVRAANADDFRIFEVGFGGDLKLSDLTVKGGVGTTTAAGGSGEGGGGLLVQEGGRATIEAATFTFNRSTRDGGAIANYGTVKLTGDGDKDGSDKHWTEDDWNNKDAAYTSIDANSAAGVFGGGGIFNDGSLTAEYTRISYNLSLTSDGGGLTNHSGVSTLRDVRIDHNNAAQDGGGVSIQGGTTTLDYSRINENTSVGDGGGFDSLGSSAVAILRDTDVNENRAIGAAAQGGGIENTLGRTTLTDTNVIGNLSVLAPGGVENNGGQVLVDDDSTIVKNRPTNCQGATTPTIPNCFG